MKSIFSGGGSDLNWVQIVDSCIYQSLESIYLEELVYSHVLDNEVPCILVDLQCSVRLRAGITGVENLNSKQCLQSKTKLSA